MEFQSLDLGEVLGHMTGLLRTAVGTGARVDVRVGADTPPVHGARGPLEQVVLNLVLNARDATGPGGEIVVETGRALVTAAEAGPEEKAGECALLSVSDTGTGIAPDALERIFEPFFSTKPEGKGTGLGLERGPRRGASARRLHPGHEPDGKGDAVRRLLARICRGP